MATENQKKKQKQLAEIEQPKSTGLNKLLWVLVVVLIAVIAFCNIYFADSFATPIRIIAVIIGLLITLGIAAVTNQGAKARQFLKESKIELRRITWPTRPETMQTTLIVIGVTVAVSLILWGFDSIIVSTINFLTDLRF
ncbi:preprotein translocase subunit SecE [Actinobacillus delphinicola]|uniref:Protein translocase subunit SecE n=1 Tax=Actinobacillus delphinicola TaxID=51161 RepID=A0A448TTJ0_9PAST|nr:preprotein translocase subunit SecE [Actinobacillus delphinicola]MDG6897449.1 preprotein translocase subunit SecE [Actinobacillus delphinicola]VEJ09327.1 preprotein translocase subunit SecE [Actinobacillus delphinicola]